MLMFFQIPVCKFGQQITSSSGVNMHAWIMEQNLNLKGKSEAHSWSRVFVGSVRHRPESLSKKCTSKQETPEEAPKQTGSLLNTGWHAGTNSRSNDIRRKIFYCIDRNLLVFNHKTNYTWANLALSKEGTHEDAHEWKDTWMKMHMKRHTETRQVTKG